MRMLHGSRWLIMTFVFCFLALSCECAWSKSLTWTLKTREKKGKGWIFKYTYPELSTSDASAGTKGMVSDFNDRILKEVQFEEETFIDNFNKDSDNLKSSVTSEYTVRCTIIGKTPDYASFLFEHLDMRASLAHPDFNYSTITWSATGKFLTLDDLCTSRKKFLDRLSAESGKLVKAKLAPKAKEMGASLDSEGWAPKVENFKNFCLTGKGLNLYFGYYQFGPRPLGVLDITIPWSSLEDLLSPMAKQLIKR